LVASASSARERAGRSDDGADDSDETAVAKSKSASAAKRASGPRSPLLARAIRLLRERTRGDEGGESEGWATERGWNLFRDEEEEEGARGAGGGAMRRGRGPLSLNEALAFVCCSS
jgi:hypothetical protein